MKFLILATVALASPVIASPAPIGLNQRQRTEVVATVREALKSDPSILRDAISAFREDDKKRKEADVKSAIIDNKKILFENPTDAWSGNKNGALMVVEFYDPRCPYCRQALTDVARVTSENQDVKIVYKEIAVLGADSDLLARAVIASENQGGHAEIQNILMHDSRKPTSGTIREAAIQSHLDPERLMSDLESSAVKAKLEENNLLARAVKIEGTPGFIFGTNKIEGSVGFSQLEAALEALRESGHSKPRISQ